MQAPIHTLIKSRDTTAREWSTGEIEAPANDQDKKRKMRAMNKIGRTFGKKG